jgi:uncharacterized protein (TIGR03492 family)
MEVLCLSNGHGEDQVAVRVALELQKLGIEVTALPMVGVGSAYTKANIPILEDGVKAMPSGGFVRMDSQQLIGDLRGGLLKLTWKQIQLVRDWSCQKTNQKRLVLAVGDIVPLILAWLPTWVGGCDFSFIATAKSEYYWRDRIGKLPEIKSPWAGSEFFPWERWLIANRRCRAAFVRDRLTAEWLNQKFRLGVQYLGNPMMDRLEPQNLNLGIDSDDWIVSILPGSRVPEVYQNWDTLIDSAEILARHLPHRAHFIAAIAPDLDQQKLSQILLKKGWTEVSGNCFSHNSAQLHLITQGFGACLHLCHLGLAMAGTATEQLVGLGKPAITIAGTGPQFTRGFALDQARLLGLSVKFIDKPSQIGSVIEQLLQDPDYFQLVVENGSERMGLPGASKAIANFLGALFGS